MKIASARSLFLSFLIQFIAYLRSVSGWKRACLAFVLGSVMALSMPPFNCFPLLWLCLPSLIFLLQGTKNFLQAFAIGWFFAFGFFVCSLYWIADSMFVDIRAFWWAVPLAVMGLPAFFAIYYGIGSALARLLGLEGLSGALTFGLLWFLADYARGHMFTGFPWNLMGYSWSGSLSVLQITSVIGIYGLTLLTSLAASLAVLLAEGSKKLRTLFCLSLLLFVSFAIGGEIRLQTTQVGTVPKVRLRLVQPDIAQALKWRLDEREAYFQDLLAMSAAPAAKPITHIIWPETASTYYLDEDPVHRQEIGLAIPASSTLLTGVIRHDEDIDGKTRFYNSLVAVDGLGRIVAGYDKSHLVPFGEFMPLRKYIPLRTLAASGADFSAGSGPRSLRVLGLPTFSPLICYEAIFPGAVIDKNDRPEFILNITNDGWYGNTIGPYQHFAIVRVRAIEEGLPLVRAANTGISGVIDPLGRIKIRLGIGQKASIDSDLPMPLALTVFGKWGETILWAVFGLITLVTIFLKNRDRFKTPAPLEQAR